MEEGERLSALFQMMMEPCREIRKIRHDDPQGGYYYTWEDGVSFDAAVIKDRTLAARVAEKDGVTEIYTVTTPPGVGLDFHEVFRRESDGATFRVTSNAQDSKPPAVASFRFEQVTAERWTLTND